MVWGGVCSTARTDLHIFPRGTINSIASMQWPVGSQDLNPIENVWGRMRRRVQALQPPLATLGELGEQIIAIWDNQNRADVLSSINSVGRRCEAVIHTRGGNTRY
jgi:hypothetical protein